MPNVFLIVSDDSPINVSKLLPDIRSTVRVPLIRSHLRDTLLGSSSLGLAGEFHTNARRFYIGYLSKMRQEPLEEKRGFLPISSASRFALTDRSGSLSEPPLRTSFAVPLSRNVMSWLSCFLPKEYVRNQRELDEIKLTLGGNIRECGRRRSRAGCGGTCGGTALKRSQRLWRGDHWSCRVTVMLALRIGVTEVRFCVRGGRERD